MRLGRECGEEETNRGSRLFWLGNTLANPCSPPAKCRRCSRATGATRARSMRVLLAGSGSEAAADGRVGD